MKAKKWIKIFTFGYFLSMCFIGSFNYIVDPYNLYEHRILDIPKTEQSSKMKLVKAIKVESIKPISISLGTSRTEYGYDPDHEFFKKPSYNLATSGASMYETRLYLEHAVRQGNLRQLLLVVDWIMFRTEMKKTPDFESYFDRFWFEDLFSSTTLVDSIFTLIGNDNATIHLEDGQRPHADNWKNIINFGGHKKDMIESEKKYFEYYPSSYVYKYSNINSFEDFIKILKLCYENNIDTTIIFGPSHIRQWEALAYYHGYESWLKYKKDVVLEVDRVAKEFHKKPFRIVDFAIYHPLTAEKLPEDKNVQMKYHWENSHYKHDLGWIVLGRLSGKDTEHIDFGVELNASNIDQHLKKLRNDRIKYIDIEAYRKEVFSE